MKIPGSNSDDRWEELLQRARTDAGPPANVPALLRAVRQAEMASRLREGGWAAEFLAVFATARVVSTCLMGAAAFAVFASWQAWETWQALPWAQLIAVTPGGAP